MTDLDDHFAGARNQIAPPDDLVDRVVLDAAFEQAKRAQPEPSQFLMARIARDAKAQRPRTPLWPALSLVAASVVGVMVGLTDPLGLISDLAGDSGALAGLPVYDFVLEEG